MGHIFLSYSRRDTEIVDRFANEITQAGLEVWIDREAIKVGNAWRVQIVEAIDTCDAMVLVLSRHSASSENVRKEVDLAQDSGRKIFVLLLERITIPAELRYQLAGLQFADVPEFGYEESSQGLIKALQEYVTSAKEPPPSRRREVELVIQGVDVAAFNKAKQEELIAFISKLADTNTAQLQIVNVTAGSVHVFMDAPASTAFTLKTMALNQDKQFRLKNISALRLKGDKKFIKISAGILTLAALAALLRTAWGKALLGGCGCLTCVAAAGVLAWQAGRLPVSLPPAIEQVITKAPLPPISRPAPITPTFEIPDTGPDITVTVTDSAGCFIALSDVYAYQGPSRGYFVASYERYHEGDRFEVLMVDRSGDWLYGILPDGVKGWLRLDWLTGDCYSPAVPTASYIPPIPPSQMPPRTPKKEQH